MKKIIWIFGESATGKKTLIVDLLHSPNSEIRKQLGLSNEIVSVAQCTIDENNASFDDSLNEKNRNNAIMRSIDEFIKSNETSILLLKGQCNDMDERYGNTLKECAVTYPDIAKEIYLLEVRDMDLLYNRIINKSWFKEDEERYKKLFPREWIDKAVIKHRKQVESYAKYGFRITTIDSTNNYTIVESERSINE
jgi:hypothetical protein